MSEEKKTKLLEMLNSGLRGLVALHVIPGVEGVELPGHLMTEQSVRLNVAYGYNSSTFIIDEEGVIVSLSFQRRKFRCVLPWESIWAILSPEENNIGYMWSFNDGHMVTVGAKEVKEEPKPKPKNPFTLIQGGKA